MPSDHNTIDDVSPCLRMSSPSAASSSGDISGNSSAAGWIGRTSRQDFEFVMRSLPIAAKWPGGYRGLPTACVTLDLAGTVRT